MGRFYDLRSRIVHGEKYTTDEIHKYLLPLTALVSRTIIELLIHNIETNKLLGRKISELGFGERAGLTTNWKEYNLNSKVTIDANWTDITGKYTPPEL